MKLRHITPTAVTYERVSTTEQRDKRYSIENQKNVIERFCTNENITIVKSFQDSYTGTKFTREGFIALREYCKKHKPTYVLVWRWDRLGRNAVEMLSAIKEFQKMGVEINAVEQWKESDKADDRFMLGLQAILAERESGVTSERIKMSMRAIQQNGIWLNKTPLGYRRSLTLNEKGKRLIEIEEKGEMIVNEIFNLFIAGMDKMKIHAQIAEQYKQELKELKYAFSIMAIRRILTNPFYLGKMVIKDSDGEPSIIDAKHPRIITDETFEKASKRMDELEAKSYRPQHAENIKYPLGGSIMCIECGMKLRAYSVKKKLAKSQKVQETHYYDCKHNHFRIQSKHAHEIIVESLEELTLSDEQLQSSKKTIIESIAKFTKYQAQKIEELTRVLVESKIKLKKLDNLLLDSLPISDYNRMKKDITDDIEVTENEIANLADFVAAQERVTQTAIKLLVDLKSNFTKLDSLTQKRLIEAIFPNGFFMDKEKRIVLTHSINTFLFIIHSKSMSYKKIHLLDADGLTLSSGNVTKIEPKKINLSYEISLINSIFMRK